MQIKGYKTHHCLMILMFPFRYRLLVHSIMANNFITSMFNYSLELSWYEYNKISCALLNWINCSRSTKVLKKETHTKNYNPFLAEEKKTMMEFCKNTIRWEQRRKEGEKSERKLYGIKCWNDLIKYCRTKFVWLHRVHIFVSEANN